MDPRDASSIHNRQPPPQPYHHHPQQGVTQPQPFGFGHHFPSTNVFMTGAAGVPNSGYPNLISNPNFSCASLTAVHHPFDSGIVARHQQQPQHQQQQPQPQQQGNGSPAPGVSAAATATATATVGSELTKKKRGRPRKNSPAPEGVTLGLASNSQPVSKADGENEVREGNAVEGSREKKQRGRPPGSRKKQSDAAGAAAGTGVAFHMVVVPAGENIVSKLVELCQGPRTIFVVGASGSVRDVTLRQVAGGTLYHEGQFDIATLSGSSCFVNSDGIQNKTLNLTIILAGPDGRLLGGGVTRELIAASAIQMVAGSFIAEKNQSNTSSIAITSPPPAPSARMLSFGGSAPLNNSTQHDTGSDSLSDDESNGNGHPQNQNPGYYDYGRAWNGGTPGWA